MARIVITVPDEDNDGDRALYVECVAQSIKEGCTSGHWDAEHHWTYHYEEAHGGQ